MKHFVNQSGNYLGAFNEGNPLIPADAIEVPTQPVDGRDKWINGAWVPHISVPKVVSRFQARVALFLAGLLDDVEAMMAAPETPALAKLAWADAQEFERASPTIAAMAGQIGLTDAQLDELFITAAGIKA